MRTTVGSVCVFLNGGTPSRSVARYFDGDVPWITGADIIGPTVDQARSFISEEAIRDSATNLVPAGTVLLVTRTSVGKVAIAGMPLCFSQDITALTPDPRKVDIGYLVHFLRTKRPHLERAARGATIKGVTREVVADIPVTLPALPEQRRIAGVLDQAEALRAKRRTALAELDTLAQTIFLDIFGEPATNPKGWPTKVLGDLVSAGPQNGLYKPASDYGLGTPILRIDAFYDGIVTDLASLKRVRISDEERTLFGLHPGEIVINRVNSREYLGKSAVIPALNEPTVFESNMMRFDVHRNILKPAFLIQYLQTSFIRSRILQSAKDAINQSSINQQDVKAFPVFVPSMAAQELFAQRLASTVRLDAVNRDSLAELDSLFTSLQYRAFRAEL